MEPFADKIAGLGMLKKEDKLGVAVPSLLIICKFYLIEQNIVLSNDLKCLPSQKSLEYYLICTMEVPYYIIFKFNIGVAVSSFFILSKFCLTELNFS